MGLEEKWGHWSISKLVFDCICDVLKKKNGDTILELGSGWASGQFAKQFKVYSVEQDTDFTTGFFRQEGVNYIYAPIDESTKWYNVDAIKQGIPSKYDIFLIDGPKGSKNRLGLMHNLGLFNKDVPWVVDDVNRDSSFDMVMDLAKYLRRPPHIYPDGTGKEWAII